MLINPPLESPASSVASVPVNSSIGSSYGFLIKSSVPTASLFCIGYPYSSTNGTESIF